MKLRAGNIEERSYINVLKSLAVYLMLWGHCIQYCCLGNFDFFENPVFKVIYSFHMPLFMLVSGYLFYYSYSKRTMKEMLSHRIKTLGYPILGGAILYYIMVPVVFELIAGNVEILLDGKWLNYLNTYWFLWSVLAASIVLTLAFSARNNLTTSLIWMIAGIVIVAVFPNKELNVYMYPYFVIGYLIGRFRKKAWMHWLYRVRWLFVPVFIIMLFYFDRDSYIYTSGLRGSGGLLNHMPVNMFRWGIGLFGSIAVATVLLAIVQSGFVPKKIISVIELPGKKSLQIYMLSCIFLSAYLPKVYGIVASFVGYNFLASNMAAYNYVYTPTLSLVYIIGLYGMVTILEKMKVSRYIFGR